jgi:hypothetical protein
MIKNFKLFLREGIDSPGSVDVPGQDYEVKVNSRNYTPANQPLPVVVDAMFESSYFTEFLDQEGKSEDFNKFLGGKKRSGSQITNYLKDSFSLKKSKSNKDQ